MRSKKILQGKKMKFLVTIFLVFLSFSALAGEKRLKVIECGTQDEVLRLLKQANEYALVGGIGQVEFTNQSKARLPTVLFINEENGTFSIIEFFPEVQEACLISFGDGVNFDVAKYFFNRD